MLEVSLPSVVKSWNMRKNNILSCFFSWKLLPDQWGSSYGETGLSNQGGAPVLFSMLTKTQVEQMDIGTFCTEREELQELRTLQLIWFGSGTASEGGARLDCH